MNKKKKLIARIVASTLAVMMAVFSPTGIMLSAMEVDAPENAMTTVEKEYMEITVREKPVLPSVTTPIVTTTITTTTTTTTTTVVTTVTTKPFYALNEDSHRVHKNSCKYYDDFMTKIEGNTVEFGRKCKTCNPDVEIIEEYTEPTEAPTERKQAVKETSTTEETGVTQETSAPSEDKTFLRTFYKGPNTGCTYYPGTQYGDPYSVSGGSGRTLIGYTGDSSGIRGSVASKYVYNLYGYKYGSNGRTTVYLSFPEYPEMNGYYYLDDCSGDDVVDVFVYYKGDCPFVNAGRVTVDCYIVH